MTLHVTPSCAGTRAVRVGAGLVALAWLAAAPPTAGAQSAQIGTVVNVVGTLVVVRPDGIEERVQGRRTLPVFERDILRTDGDSRALVDLREGGRLALNEKTSVRLLLRWEKDKAGARIVRLQGGEVWVKLDGGPGRLFTEARPLEVEMPVGTAAAREGEFVVATRDPGQGAVTSVQGTIEFATAFGTCRLDSSTASSATRGKRCADAAPADARASAAWTAAVLR